MTRLEYLQNNGFGYKAAKYVRMAERFEKEDVQKSTKHKHHLIPRCCGGLNDELNLISITPYHHKILHSYLLQMYRPKKQNNCITKKQYLKLLYAFTLMKKSRTYSIN